MAVNFYKGRMHVGNRMRDWSDVWLELDVPKGDQASIDLNTDREYDFELYKGKFKTSGNEIREPDPSEVVWHSHFDVATFEAKTKQMREKIQKQFYQIHGSISRPEIQRKSRISKRCLINRIGQDGSHGSDSQSSTSGGRYEIGYSHTIWRTLIWKGEADDCRTMESTTTTTILTMIQLKIATATDQDQMDPWALLQIGHLTRTGAGAGQGEMEVEA